MANLLKSRDITLLTKVHIVKAMVFPIVMYSCERWNIKRAESRRTDAFELWCWRRLLRVPGTARKSKKVNPKGNWPWIFIGRTSAEAETPVPWSPDANSRLIGKDCDAGKDWRQEEKGTAEDEMVGGHHRLNGHEFPQAPGVDDEQRSLHAAARGVAKSQTLLSYWTATNRVAVTESWLLRSTLWTQVWHSADLVSVLMDPT